MPGVRSGREGGVMVMDVREKLVEIFCSALGVEPDVSNAEAMEFVEELIAHGVTVQEQDGCPSHETVKESGAYLCGVLDERKRKQTNADRIRAMSDEELAAFLLNFFVEHMDINSIPHEAITAADEVELLRQLQQPAED